MSAAGQDLKLWRKQSNLDQAALATEFGVSRATVGRWEAANSLPKLVVLAMVGWEGERFRVWKAQVTR